MEKRIISRYEDIEQFQVVLYMNIYNYGLIRQKEIENSGYTMDGIGLVLLSRLFGLAPERLNPDYSGYLKDYLSRKRVHIYASTEGELKSFAARQHSFEIVAMIDGYSNISHFHKVIGEKICDGDVVLVGRGSPLQETTIAELAVCYKSCQFIAVGAFISQFSNWNNYYPRLIDRLHLRMPYRMVRERLYYRLPTYIVNPIRFVIDGFFCDAFKKMT